MRVAPGILAVALGLITVACGGPAPSASAPPPSPVPLPTVATPVIVPASVVVDASLLDALPASIAGIDLVADDETAAEIAAGPGLADSVASIAVGLYAGVGPSPEEDLAIVNVVTLRDGVFDDAFFRSWRETYDAAACEPAGGVAVGAAEAEIDGRTVFIGTCVNGGHTYHVHLDDPERLLAITAFGDDRLGEQVVAGSVE